MKKIQRVKTGENLSRKIIAALTGYVKAQLLIIICVSLVIWLILSVLPVKYALLLAIMTGSLSVIPAAGMMVAAIVAALFAVFDGVRFLPTMDPAFEGLTIMAIYLTVNFLIDYIVSPFLTGKITNIHPGVSMAAVVIGTLLFGIPGTILALPALIVIKTVLDDKKDNN